MQQLATSKIFKTIICCQQKYPHLFSVLSGGTVLDGETAGDEVILDIHDDEGGLGLDDLGDPAVPAVYELLHAHAAVPRHVEDHEQVADLLAVQGIGLTLN